jgi:hypothetical protein
MMERVCLPHAAFSQMSVVFLLTIIPPLIARADGAHVRLLLLFIPEWLAMGWVLVPMFRSPFEMSDVRGKGACTYMSQSCSPHHPSPWGTPMVCAHTHHTRRIPVLLALLYWCWECGKSLRHWNRFCLCHPGAWRNRFNHDGWPALFFISMVSPLADALFLLRARPAPITSPSRPSSRILFHTFPAPTPTSSDAWSRVCVCVCVCLPSQHAFSRSNHGSSFLLFHMEQGVSPVAVPLILLSTNEAGVTRAGYSAVFCLPLALLGLVGLMGHRGLVRFGRAYGRELRPPYVCPVLVPLPSLRPQRC